MRSLLAAALVLSCACSTITFKTKLPEARRSSGEVTSEWHHGGFVNLVEFSPPVDLTDRCGRGARWASVTVEAGPAQVATCLVGALGVLYCPWEVSVACGR